MSNKPIPDHRPQLLAHAQDVLAHPERYPPIAQICARKIIARQTNNAPLKEQLLKKGRKETK